MDKTPTQPNATDAHGGGAISPLDIIYILQLFVVNSTPRSMRAITNIAKICEEHLDGRFELEIVDISLNPARAVNEQILAAPTLIRKLPLPHRRFIGDMSQTVRILAGLGLQAGGRLSPETSADPQCK